MEIAELYKIYKQYPSIQTDTRKIKPGDIFFALKGPNFNGNSFAALALENGAAYAVIDEVHYAKSDKYILVEDVLIALQQLAKYHREKFSVPFIAITGSNGKTTTKELITTVLLQKYKTYATKGNLNNHIGVPLTLLSIRTDAEMAVIEMGANHQKEIASYCEIALPTHGIITNCGKAHIEGFGGEEGVRKGKGELYDFIRAHNGIIFRNTDLPYLETMASGIKQQVTYGSTNAYFVGRPLTDETFLKVAILSAGSETTIHTNLVGDYNFSNVMVAVAVGLHFKIPIALIKKGIEGYQPDNSRSQLIQLGSNKIILDAYNANPTSMRAAISNFSLFEHSNKILWLGGMKEMGEDEAYEHEELIKFVEQFNWNDVILIGREFQSVQGSYKWFENATEAAGFIARHKPSQAMILIKGSRGSRMELLLDTLKN